VASEIKKGFYRISTNYARLFSTMAMGIAAVPLQIRWLGLEGFGLLSLVGSSVGIGGMLQDMMRSSMVRELGAAWHQRENGKFKESYAASFRVSAVVALLTAVAFGIIIAIIPLLKIKEEWIEPAQWITGCEGLASCLIVLLAPALNMLVVREQFFWHNLWTVARRSSYLIATIIPFLIMQVTDLNHGLILFGNIVLIVNVASTLLLLLGLIIADKRMIPTIRGATPEAMKKVAGTFGWNSGVVLAMNLHERIANIIMNLFFGLWGTGIFSLALRLVSYIRMLSLGITFGLDSVSTRLSSSEKNSSLQQMFKHSTRMLSFVSFPAMVVVFIIAEPLLRMWVGRSLEKPELMLPSTEILVKIMVLGLACRAVSDGWMKLFYGAGHIKKYAPYIFIGGICNPILSILLIILLPENQSYIGAAVAYTSVLLIFHIVIMPKVTASSVGLTYKQIIQPTVGPFIIAILASPALFSAYYFSNSELLHWADVIFGVCTYGGAYIIASWCFLFTKKERKSLARLGLQLVGR
jgi:O-antigen/teichoic acid export membrane protein